VRDEDLAYEDALFHAAGAAERVTISERAAVVAGLRQTLLASANQTGGWGYYAGKGSRIEPTAWALLALAESSESKASDWQAFAAPHLRFLRECQRVNGLLAEAPGVPPNFTANGVAACALGHLAATEQKPLLTGVLDAIVVVKGAAVTSSFDAAVAAVKRIVGGNKAPQSGQDNSLQAWPWIPDTFSWVEPTSWCLLGLKKASPSLRPREAAARVQEADALLINRICATGGWNYGNAAAFGQDLRAYVPTTAVGLIALQDRRNEPGVDRTVAFLDRSRLKEPSGMALALTAVALRLFGLQVNDVEDGLAADAERAQRNGNLQTLAMMLYALSADRHGVRAFRV
jgi:hypothetical protein